MRLRQINLVRAIVTFVVMLSLAFLPILYQQAMAGHHDQRGVTFDVIESGMVHESGTSSSCNEKSGPQSTDIQTNCCDMSCSTVVTFEAVEVLAFQLRAADRFEIDADQLTSRIMFGLMRSPRG